jgi:hypothetical protein
MKHRVRLGIVSSVLSQIADMNLRPNAEEIEAIALRIPARPRQQTSSRSKSLDRMLRKRPKVKL